MDIKSKRTVLRTKITKASKGLVTYTLQELQIINEFNKEYPKAITLKDKKRK